MYNKIDGLSMGKKPDANRYWSNEVQFRAQPSMLKCIEDLVEELKEVSFRPAALPYNKRMSLLSAMETEYEKLYDFGKEVEDKTLYYEGDKEYTKDFLDALVKDCIVKVDIFFNGEIAVTAPPLGDRLGGKSSFLFNILVCMQRYFIKQHYFDRPTDGCIIVKQYCHCAEVAMGTTENREIHAITDKLLNYLGLDDCLWNVDVCYVWCESDCPRTEIIVTTRERAKEYCYYSAKLYEKKPEIIDLEDIEKAKGDLLMLHLGEARQVLLAMGGIPAFDNGLMDQASSKQFISLIKALKEILTALREPHVNAADHKYSKLYAIKKAPKNKGRRKNENDNHILFDASSFIYDVLPNELVVYTYSPYAIDREGGRDLCDEQAEIIEKAAAEYDQDNPLCLDRDDDIAVEIERYVEKNVHYYPDSDNMNTTFLRCYGSRVKVIYCRTVKTKTRPESTDCVIHIRPASCAKFPN